MRETAARSVVIVPTYNERDNVGALAQRLFDATGGTLDLLIVDDGSPDGTAQAARDLSPAIPGVHVLERRNARGLGTAKIAGIRWALARDYAAVVEMDGDLSHDPAVVPDLLRDLEHADLVIGSRYIPGGAIPRWSLPRRALSRGGNLYQSWMLGMGVRDATSGFRAYRRAMLERIELDAIHLEGYVFLIEMVRRVHEAGGRILEHPIVFAERHAGASKIDARIVLEAFVHVSRCGLMSRLGRNRSAPRRGPGGGAGRTGAAG